MASRLAQVWPLRAVVEAVLYLDRAGCAWRYLAFDVLPRRWVVERTFDWISKQRRTVRDYKRLPARHEAMIVWTMIPLMARRLA